MTIADMYPNFEKYRTYLIGGCCLVSCIIGALLLPRGMFVISKYSLESVIDNLMCSCLALWVVTVYWVYGVGRLSDDIQFMKGVQPTKFWKILWYVIPLGFLLLCGLYFHILISWELYYLLANVVVLTSCLTPFFGFVFMEMFLNLRKRNMLGIFQPHPKWGPPDADERLYRKFFNPRTETKYQAHKMICSHKCLTNSEVLKDTIKQEDELRAEFFKWKYPEDDIIETISQSELSSLSTMSDSD